MNDFKVAVIGLGYVGLPLAVEFARKYSVTGFDTNIQRVTELNKGIDATLEVEEADLKSVLKKEADDTIGICISNQVQTIENANFYIVTVPTPVDKYNKPDLTHLYKASETVGRVLKRGDIVVYESTVYPGVTEDECVPVLQRTSGLSYNTDFYAGYSPERINPGDKLHTVTKIKKLTSGSTPEIAAVINNMYASIITAGTYLAPSIKVAEAAKVIENAQRDINIAFINELSKIFNIMEIDTGEVLLAAGTKWNFIQFRPGLVGGHCTGVDPYYLAQKAMELGYHPEIILAGRRLNDGMGAYVADEMIKLMIRKGIQVIGSRVLVMGITFKENCTDFRNTKVIDIIQKLEEYNIQVVVHDPWANPEAVNEVYGIRNLTRMPETSDFDGVVLAVAHRQFSYETIKKVCKPNCVIYDVKSMLEKGLVDGRL